MEDLRSYLLEEMNRRQQGHDRNKQIINQRQGELDAMVNMPVENRQDITPYVSLVDSWTGSNLAKTVKPPASVRDDIKQALSMRLQAPKESPIEMALALENLRSKEDIARMRAQRGVGGKPLPATTQARLDSARLALGALDDIDAHLNSGGSVSPGWFQGLRGDNRFSEASKRWAEGFGRMQSGGAITKDEEERFMAMLPRPMDSAEIRRLKLQRLRDEVNQRVQGIQSGGIPGSMGESGGVDLSGMSDAELQRIINGN